MESVQKYDSEGWNYMAELKAFVDGKYEDPGFINAVSGIVNRGCHNPVSVNNARSLWQMKLKLMLFL